jgi:predicted nucleotidyltransferase
MPMRPDLVPPELLERVVRYFDPEAVILFGSHARGDAGPDSDYDLLVVLPDDAPPEKRTLRAGFEAARAFPMAADVVPCRRSWFLDRREVVNSLPWIASTEGVVVYERP